jgi:hypothetical protein
MGTGRFTIMRVLPRLFAESDQPIAMRVFSLQIDLHSVSAPTAWRGVCEAIALKSYWRLRIIMKMLDCR